MFNFKVSTWPFADTWEGGGGGSVTDRPTDIVTSALNWPKAGLSEKKNCHLVFSLYLFYLWATDTAIEI